MARRHRVWQGGEEEAFSDGIQQNSIEFTTFNWSSLICVRSLRYNLSAVGVKIHCVRIQEEKISVESFEVLNTFRVSNGQDWTLTFVSKFWICAYKCTIDSTPEHKDLITTKEQTCRDNTTQWLKSTSWLHGWNLGWGQWGPLGGPLRMETKI